jgi:AcrR family transcriptional regulator
MAKDVQVAAKKLEIVKWAFDRFYEGGFHATGIDTMMADSGISKRTLYKYFSCKEGLIEAVLDYYGEVATRELFDPVKALSDDPHRQILALFDIRKAMSDKNPIRGCLGIKASQEFVGRHQGIATQAKSAAQYVERNFIEMCQRAGFAKPTSLGKQINILFQGAVLLSQVLGESSPFVSAKAAVSSLLDAAGPSNKTRVESARPRIGRSKQPS